MFITLRTSGAQNEAGGGMEQVVRRNAGPNGVKNRVRPTRRPACVACQTKKLRCTGSPRNCDRCRARLVECVFPGNSGNGQDDHRTHSSRPSSASRIEWQKLSEVSTQQGDLSRDSTSSSDGADGPTLDSSSRPQQQQQQQQQQAGTTSPTVPSGVDTLEGDFFDYVIDGLDIDIDDLGQESAPVEVRPSVTSIHSGTSESSGYQPNKSPQQGAYDPLGSYLSGTLAAQGKCPVTQAQSRTAPETTAQELPSMLALDAGPLSPAQSWALSGVPSQPNRSGSPPCSCLSDLVRVVQQLDDDEFHITTMSLDQVLQLQKWLVFQCCKPLDCPKCLDLSTIHTVRLILCDRLTEMFECIHKRVKSASAILIGHNSDSSSHSASSQSPDSHSSHHSLHSAPPLPTAAVGTGPLPAQLFCSTSGRAANATACNPLMFSDEFRNQYSDEEQVHMIRVLLRLQIRNFQKLLLRVERTSHTVANQARQSKVKSMMVRLSKAGGDIEGALRLVFQALSIG
ncbi:hypothetical protein B0I37DRAFT_373903 [Chaetomium sp. MPI-CAGE-AT-0009]|nr:hypothetical protein B0I37DRAFT_373903 [Chaetomium sp. MPI-CAGE-AT-0009]